ncbi:carbon monoxide dehydrogenase subunit G [Nitratireductor sp. XY-223]|uniref:SRPBCC family protein n=1 Tax=Nitratireductor sp. XY-223 TaxID=2561926 RepID=UPI0010AAA9BE|nr:carbon monoxide dehydrogenase subunit G [Nitratireductor sp. XY-223]
MNLTGQYTIAAPRQEIWAALNDPDVLKRCIPGCESLEKISDTDFTGRVTMKVGAVKARLKGNVVLSDIDAPNGYTIVGQGQGGVAGFAKGRAQVTLAETDDGGTLLRYEAAAELGGKLAAVGSRVLQGIAKKMADDFFGKFAAHFGDADKERAAAAQAASVETNPMAETSPVPAVPMETARSSDIRNLAGTARDLLWFVIGMAVGAGLILGFAV